ncbi:MAG: hypothetical protein KC912_05695 [Proteobacteria bacterium]|nr:hypothetical protein [Pseudomonadota bacterium]
MQTRCPTCFRAESIEDGVTTVTVEGGLRRSAEPEGLASWRIVRRALEGGPAVVGRCSVCALPLHGDGPAIAWTIALPSGDLKIADGKIAGKDGAVAIDDAEALIEAALVTPPTLARTLYEGAMFSWLIVPFFIWISAMFCFAGFLCIGVPHGAEFMPR